MMGPRQVAQGSFFYAFSIEDHLPDDHLLRKIDHFLDLSDIRKYLAPFYSHQGRPSVDPELMIRMLLVGYCFGIRSERRLCEEVHLNLAYRWFCRLYLVDKVPDHSTFSKNRHGRFRDSDLFRQVFETVLTRSIAEGLVGGALHMLDRAREIFGLYPEKFVADGAYGNAETLSWLVEGLGVEPHVPVLDQSARKDGTFARVDFTFDHENDCYICPGKKELVSQRRNFQTIREKPKDDESVRYRAKKADCAACSLKSECCPNMDTRQITRSIHEGARELARNIAKTDAFVDSRHARKKVEMLFAHLKKIMGLTRLRLRGPNGAKDEFTLAATAQNLRKMAKLLPMPA